MTTIISTHFFKFNKETKTFSSKISKLPKNFRFVDYFIMQSQWTGKKVKFKTEKIDLNAEGELQGWNFKCDLGFKALIIND